MSERKTKEKEMIEKLTLSIITMKFSRFITVVFFNFFLFVIFDHLNNNDKGRNSWTAKFEAKYYNYLSVLLKSHLI